MTVTALPVEQQQESDSEDDWDHYYCPNADPDTAYCGADISDSLVMEEFDAMDHECPLCAVIMDAAGDICPKCKKHIDTHE